VPQVPDQFPASIDGRPYVVDLENFQRASIEKVRQQGDSGREFGEASLNPFSLWRRSQDDWSGGAGQEYLDKREESLRRRFFDSSRLDVWERGTARLSGAAAYYGEVVGGIIRMGVTNGKVWYVRQNGTAWELHVLAGTSLETSSGLYPAPDLFPGAALFPLAGSSGFILEHSEALSTAQDACTDGIHIYVLDEDGVKVTDTDGTAPTILNAQTGQRIAYVRGRLLIANNYDLWNVMNSTTIVRLTPVTTVNSTWTWDAFGETTDSIYVAGHSGDQAYIYRITVEEDGVNLAPPTVAAALPFGEICMSLYGYVGVLIMGTTEGLRVATTDGNGHLFYGPLIDVGGEVSVLTAFGRFVYFGGTNMERSFIGRIDLGLFVNELQPAWAIDLWDDTNDRTLMGAFNEEMVHSLLIAGGRLVWYIEVSNDSFATSESHVWFQEDNAFSTTGYVSSGKMTYDLADTKVFERIQVLCEPLNSGEEIQVYVSVDGVEQLLGSVSTLGSTGDTFELGGLTGDTVEYRVVLNRGPASNVTPILQRATLGALPIAQQGDIFQLPLILREVVWDMNGREYHYEPDEEFDALKAIERAGTPVTLKLWGKTYRAVIDAVQWGPELDYRVDQRGVQGTCTVLMRTFDAES
jgi:hypothetical protein